ncbi:hypothetical protein [Streptomyces nigrescens]|uniref:Uncharacterized protein n=1 Tax=Streptomyces nigrescens TaxID=1920 RepID=A0ABY7J689_STRNI|nr:hypothetical protein [Streptomyces nigrescens]WAU06063.1 hypothetical protein STRNI_004517 [Streptomyces nigrescens]WAU09964.1 hypothetical protein STRNI_008250 [Streptomyces nigrescens]
MAPPVATAPAAVATKPVPVNITTRPAVDDEIEFVDDLDSLAGNEAMRGCGNDNPY